MLLTTIEQVDNYLRSYNRDGNSDRAMWHGYNIVFFKPDPTAEFDSDGMYIAGTWGYGEVIEPDKEGWHVPE